MSRLEDYADRYANLRMERRGGVLEVVFHTNGGPLIWNDRAHTETPDAFYQISQDPENRVIILTGTGDAFFSGFEPGSFQFDPGTPPVALDRMFREGKALIHNLLNIPVPIIGAMNGPARGHSELILLCDIAIASDNAEMDDPHLGYGMVPGDGIHIAFPLAFGMNRGRYLMLTGKSVTAQQALEWGGIAEVMPLEKLRSRAWELAEELAKRPILGLRYTRELINTEIQRLFQSNMTLGLALEGFSSGYGAWGGTLNEQTVD